MCESNNTGGRWSKQAKDLHISNVLELLAVEYGLKSVHKEVCGQHVKVLSDNTCAVSYLKHMGGSHSDACNSVAKRVGCGAKRTISG